LLLFFKNLEAPASIATDSQSNIPVDQYDFAQALNDADAAFAPFRQSPKKLDMIRIPNWLDYDDPLLEFLGRQRKMLETGKIIFGAITIANTLLFEPGRDNCPGKMIYSFDTKFLENPQALHILSEGVYDHRGEKNLPEETMQALADLLNDDYGRTLYAPLPKLFCDGATVGLSSVMFERRHLISGVINSVMPILASPWEPGIMVLPARFWPSSLQPALAYHLQRPIEVDRFE
jgi:hypothetical protein